MKRLLYLLSIVFLIGNLNLVSAETPAQQPTLKLGAVLGLTGGASVHSLNIKNGIELAKKDLESKGWKVDVAYEDDGTVPVKTVSSVQNLIAKNYKLFIGPVWSFQVEAISPLAKKSDSLFFAPACSSQIVGGPNPNIFHGTSLTSGKIFPLTNWLKENNLKKVAISCAEGAWCEVHKEIYKEAADAAGAQVVLTESYQYGQESSAIPTIITKAKSKGADVILMTGDADGASQFVRSMRDQQMKAKVVSADDLADALNQGLITVDEKTPELYDLSVGVSDEFKNRYHAMYGSEPGVYSDSAYDGVMILAEAVSHTDGTIPAVRKYLKNDLNYHGVSGTFKYDNNGDVRKSVFVVHKLNH